MEIDVKVTDAIAAESEILKILHKCITKITPKVISNMFSLVKIANKTQRWFPAVNRL